MTTIGPRATLADLVTNHPSLARELERLGLDYCCHGSRTLAIACAGLGLDPDLTTAELARAAAPEPVAPTANMGIVELVDHLLDAHHRYLWDEMPRLSALLDKIVVVHGDRHPELVETRRCYEKIRLDMEPHLLKEERVLFPMIRTLAASHTTPAFHCGTLQNPISMMRNEHDRVGELLRELRTLTNGYQTPEDGCASYRACFAALAGLEADTHLHIHKENNQLFPAVLRLEQQLSVNG